jgi:Amt family ammonium transporter
MIGSFIVTVCTFAVAYAVMYVLNAVKVLRVSEEGEMYGLDLHEHGISAYPEYMITSAGRPSGMHTDPAVPVTAPAGVPLARQPQTS